MVAAPTHGPREPHLWNPLLHEVRTELRRIQQKGWRVSSKAETETASQRPPRSPGSFAAGEAGCRAARTRGGHMEKPTGGGAKGCRQQRRTTSQLCEQAASEAVPSVRASPSIYGGPVEIQLGVRRHPKTDHSALLLLNPLV